MCGRYERSVKKVLEKAEMLKTYPNGRNKMIGADNRQKRMVWLVLKNHQKNK